MTPSRLFFNEKFPALVPNKILVSSVSNGLSVWVNKFNIVIEELVSLFIYHSYNMISSIIRINTEISLCRRKIVTNGVSSTRDLVGLCS